MRYDSYRQFRLFPFLVVLLSFSVEIKAYVIRDLESNIQNFVLETKKIDIPGYPDAFNPSIIRWNERLLMCFRIRDPITLLTHRIGLVWLDAEFNPLTPPQVIEMASQEALFFGQTQDPRLVKIDQHLMIVFNAFFKTSLGTNRRMAYSKLVEDQGVFFADPPIYLLDFENEDPKKQEKNWIPFDYNGELFFNYSIEPHRVLQPIADTNSCATFSQTSAHIKWNWGILRGGSPAEKINDQYVAFFHSVKDMVSLQSKGLRIIHYFMGAYTFNTEPPFNVTKISPEPIVGKNFYNGPAYDTWKPLLVVFPGGYIHDENHIWIAYGRQDHEVWIVKLDKEVFLNSLLPVYPVP
jgi:predicted GH43/DUF377 family glycosyl hydrolase